MQTKLQNGCSHRHNVNKFVTPSLTRLIGEPKSRNSGLFLWSVESYRQCTVGNSSHTATLSRRTHRQAAKTVTLTAVAYFCATGRTSNMILHNSSGTVNGDQRLIRVGDLVIVYERHDSMKSVYVTPGLVYGNRYGNFKLKASRRPSD